jgi:hypothetical protein
MMMVEDTPIKNKSIEGTKPRNINVEGARGSQPILSRRDPFIRCRDLATGGVSAGFCSARSLLEKKRRPVADGCGNRHLESSN